MGDLGLFNALIDSMAMPERWRRRLKHQFWRPSAFRSLLQRFAKPATFKRTAISAHVDAIAGQDAEQATAARVADLGLPLVTDRSVAEVAARLSEKLADRSETPLDPAKVRLIESYLALEGSVTDVIADLARLPGSPALDGARRWFETRIEALEDQGLNPRRFHFSANFGRELEYYTGLVFQGRGRGPQRTIGRGGRWPLQRLAAGSWRCVACARRGLCHPHRAREGGAGMILTLGIPSKGRLMEATAASSRKPAWPLSGRAATGATAARFRGWMESKWLSLSASEIAGQLRDGKINLGVTGEDLLREKIPPTDETVDVAVRLGFGPANVVVAVPECWLDVAAMADLDEVAEQFYRAHGRRIRVATKYVHLTRRWFATHGVTGYRIVDSSGATEGAPAAGLAELIVDITTTGSTLAANHLRILDDGLILESCAVLALRRANAADTRLQTLVSALSKAL